MMDEENVKKGRELYIVFYEDNSGWNFDGVFNKREDCVSYIKGIGRSEKLRRNFWEVEINGKTYTHKIVESPLITKYLG